MSAIFRCALYEGALLDGYCSTYIVGESRNGNRAGFLFAARSVCIVESGAWRQYGSANVSISGSTVIQYYSPILKSLAGSSNKALLL
jgi:hypothetical protein